MTGPLSELLHEAHALIEKDGIVTVFQGELVKCDTLCELGDLSDKRGEPIVFITPYCTIRERGYEAKGSEPILAIVVQKEEQYSVAELLRELRPFSQPVFGRFEPNVSDEQFAEIVQTVQTNEIFHGNVAQVIISRSFECEFKRSGREDFLGAYGALIRGHGQYMTFCFCDGNNDGLVYLGASPERHLQITQDSTLMNPIAGTLRKGRHEGFIEELVDFILSEKEKNELFHVLDEEMKMMACICPRGGRVTGPFLREIDSVIHTEYRLRGLRGTNTIDALRHSLHAPTLVGGPSESAARIIAQYETESRRYYGGEIGVLRPDGTLDSAIMIRCAELSGSDLASVRAGAGIVHDSDPVSEALETTAKAAGVIGRLSGNMSSNSRMLTPTIESLMSPYLNLRNTHLSRFLVQSQVIEEVEGLADKKILIVNNEDNFSFVLGHMIRHMGCEVEIQDVEILDSVPTAYDLVLLGPGPGNINDLDDIRMNSLRRITKELLMRQTPTLGICLGHQAIALELGIPVVKQTVCTQGIQRRVRLFSGEHVRVGYYNSFSPKCNPNTTPTGVTTVTDDDGYLTSIKGRQFVGYQFHPESVMSEEGYRIMLETLSQLL